MNPIKKILGDKHSKNMSEPKVGDIVKVRKGGVGTIKSKKWNWGRIGPQREYRVDLGNGRDEPITDYDIEE